jgi:hypothetical protein
VTEVTEADCCIRQELQVPAVAFDSKGETAFARAVKKARGPNRLD